MGLLLWCLLFFYLYCIFEIAFFTFYKISSHFLLGQWIAKFVLDLMDYNLPNFQFSIYFLELIFMYFHKSMYIYIIMSMSMCLLLLLEYLFVILLSTI